MKNIQNIGTVLSSSPNMIVAEITDLFVDGNELSGLSLFSASKESLQIGDYLKIQQTNLTFVIAVIVNVFGENHIDEGILKWRFTINCQPVGTLNAENVFEKGSSILPLPTEPVYILDDETFKSIFAQDKSYDFYLGKLSNNLKVPISLHGDRFFGRHIGVVGSTGSGKSCAVTKILHEAVGITTESVNQHATQQRNSHIIIFDIHSEYKAAFELDSKENFTLNLLDIDSLKLPYWLMNSEELENIFIESNETNSHNQVSQFKAAVIENKKRNNPNFKEITYDTPCYFSILEVYNYIHNINREVTDKATGKPQLKDTLVENRFDHYFTSQVEFAPPSQKADGNVKGPFGGEFNRFVSRLETKLSDKRLEFLLKPKKTEDKEYKSEDFEEIVQQYLGYNINRANVTVIDLSGVPFEVLSITISLISRLVFDFCFHYTKLRHDVGELNDIPVMLVCEEAHNYVPQNDSSDYKASRKSIERIAKEGRKYGLSLMVVSQRPSEVSETIFAQCSNFIALRLTNNNDQAYIKRLMPNNSTTITDILPNLSDGECLVVGTAVLLPSIVKIDLPKPQPQSQNVKFYNEWKNQWREILFSDVVSRWRNEKKSISDPA